MSPLVGAAWRVGVAFGLAGTEHHISAAGEARLPGITRIPGETAACSLSNYGLVPLPVLGALGAGTGAGVVVLLPTELLPLPLDALPPTDGAGLPPPLAPSLRMQSSRSLPSRGLHFSGTLAVAPAAPVALPPAPVVLRSLEPEAVPPAEAPPLTPEPDVVPLAPVVPLAEPEAEL